MRDAKRREEVECLLADWHRRARQSQRIQYDSGTHFDRSQHRLGWPTIVITTVVGTSTFASLALRDGIWLPVLTGSLAMLAAVLVGLQTFLKYADRAAQHRVCSSQYGAIRRQIEMLMTFLPEDDAAVQRKLEAIKRKMDALAKSSPPVSARIKAQAVQALERKPRKHRLFSKFDGEHIGEVSPRTLQDQSAPEIVNEQQGRVN